MPVEATNSVSGDIQPLSLAIEPGSSPAFVSDDTATATAGTPFDFGVRTASCPAINDYTLQGTDAATSSAVSISQSFTLTVKGLPATAPGAPAIGAATAGNAQATVSFTPPASDGGAAITKYTVTATDHTNAANGGQTATGTGSPVTGLTNGDSYTFTETVTVTNHGQWPATSIRTAVTVPSQLTVTADPGGTTSGPVVSWTAASLGTNQSVTYTITFKVTAKARGTALLAAATASPKVADPKPLNNAALIVKLG